MDNIKIIDVDTNESKEFYIMKHLPRQGEEFSINGKTGIIQKVSWLQTSTYCFISIYVKFNN
jgi:hypothetical protein